MSPPPRVSVLMAVRDGLPYLPEALASVLAQTWRDLELVVVDDGSTDGSREVLAACTDPRVRVIHAPSRGLAASLALLVSEARGELLARMDADDVCAPDRLARQVAAMDAHPHVGLVDSLVHRIDAAGRPLPPEDADAGPTLLARRFRLLWQNNVVHPTVMLRRSVLAASGLTYREAQVAEDFELWGRMLFDTSFLRLPDRLLRYRVNPSGITARHGREHFDAIARMIGDRLSRLLGRDPGRGLAEDLAMLSRQTRQRPEEHEPCSSAAVLVELLDSARNRFLERFSTDPRDARDLRADCGDRLLEWAFTLARCPGARVGDTAPLVRAALAGRPGAAVSPRFARWVAAVALGPRWLARLRSRLRGTDREPGA
jgi:hypothetical protein